MSIILAVETVRFASYQAQNRSYTYKQVEAVRYNKNVYLNIFLRIRIV